MGVVRQSRWTACKSTRESRGGGGSLGHAAACMTACTVYLDSQCGSVPHEHSPTEIDARDSHFLAHTMAHIPQCTSHNVHLELGARGQRRKRQASQTHCAWAPQLVQPAQSHHSGGSRGQETRAVKPQATRKTSIGANDCSTSKKNPRLILRSCFTYCRSRHPRNTF
jgi:hypothetical protein